MMVALWVLLSCERLGDALSAVLGLPIPGTFIGMLLLPAILILMRPRSRNHGQHPDARAAALAMRARH